MSAENVVLLKTLLPVLLAAITLVGGVIVYNVQKAVDRKDQIHEERRGTYRKFVVSYQDLEHHMIHVNDPEVQMAIFNELKKVCAEIALTAPDGVVTACSDIPRLFTSVGTAMYTRDGTTDVDSRAQARRELHNQYLKVISEMRKDSFETTDVSAKVLSNLVQNLQLSIGIR